MKNIDELQVKISGRSSFAKKLELGQSVELIVSGGVVKEETCDNQDGSVSICYIIKPITIEENGQINNKTRNNNLS